MKNEATAPQFEALLRGLVGRVPFLKLVSLKSHAKLSTDPHDRADLLARVLAGDRKWVLAVEKRAHGQPREVRTAVLQLERHLKRLPGDVAGYGVLLAPFLSEESARICEDAGIGYADLAGNARLSFDQVFIETRSSENPFREKRETQSLFSPRATRVLRVLLQGPIRAWRVTDLAESARVSLGWVSAVRRQLLAREWAVAEPGGVRVTKPALVVEAWAKADEWEKRTQAQEYSVLIHEPLAVAEKLQEILPDEPPVFTQWFAAWLRHPYTTPAIVTAYVRRLPEDLLIQEKLLGRRVTDGGGRLRLVVPKDEGVLNPQQTVQGFQLVSDVQIYLDLQRAGLRAGEQAEELRRWPDFAGGWG